MYEQYKQLNEPNKNGSIVRLWGRLYLSTILQTQVSEYFCLYELC